MIKVSICVPVYNVEKYISRCLTSILSQSYENIEVIVVNDCSPDDSMKIVADFAKRDSRIHVMEHEVNRGLMVARKTGYMAATGDYITFCDSDDELPDRAIEKLLDAIGDADIAAGTIAYIDAKGNQSTWKQILKYGGDKLSLVRSLFSKEIGHNLCSKLFKREILQGEDYCTYENFTNAEDGLLFYQIVNNLNNGVVCIQDVVYNYYENTQSSTHVQISDQALGGILKLYDYIHKNVSTDCTETLINLKERYLVYELNEWALICGVQKVKGLLIDNPLAYYITFNRRVKYLTIKENIRWILKFVFKR